MSKKLLFIFLFFLLIAYSNKQGEKMKEKKDQYKKIVLAGGCFWCMEPPYDKLNGVKETIVGYAGGKEKDPSYEQVAYGLTGHTEAIEITYDPQLISLEKILDLFWVNIDPLQKDGQFCDKGLQYRTAIFFNTPKEKKMALVSQEKAKKKIKELGDFVTEIVEFSSFYPAEDYHQDYYIKNPYRYKTYRYFCGRNNRLKNLWQE